LIEDGDELLKASISIDWDKKTVERRGVGDDEEMLATVGLGDEVIHAPEQVPVGGNDRFAVMLNILGGKTKVFLYAASEVDAEGGHDDVGWFSADIGDKVIDKRELVKSTNKFFPSVDFQQLLDPGALFLTLKFTVLHVF
jgi:hypothetical protein